MREKEIEKILVSEVKKLGGRAYKWVSPGNAGVPDRIVILPGSSPVFLELKAGGGTLTALQKAQIDRLRDLGQPVMVAKGLDGLCRFFQGLGYGETSKAIGHKYNLQNKSRAGGGGGAK